MHTSHVKCSSVVLCCPCVFVEMDSVRPPYRLPPSTVFLWLSLAFALQFLFRSISKKQKGFHRRIRSLNAIKMIDPNGSEITFCALVSYSVRCGECQKSDTFRLPCFVVNRGKSTEKVLIPLPDWPSTSCQVVVRMRQLFIWMAVNRGKGKLSVGRPDWPWLCA